MKPAYIQTMAWEPNGPRRSARQGTEVGGTRRLVACSKANASSSSFGSLHAIPVKLTPNGAGFGSKPAGKGFAGGPPGAPPPPPPKGTLGTKAKGTITVG